MGAETQLELNTSKLNQGNETRGAKLNTLHERERTTMIKLEVTNEKNHMTKKKT